MAYTTLISAQELAQHLEAPDWAVIDCRYSAEDKEAGRQAYRQAHIPGAVYAHIDEDLAAAHVPGQTGRHPLPDVETLAQTLSGWGIGAGVQVVAYDEGGGQYAARLWWMLHWLGHEAIAVLDGGWAAWQAGDYPVLGGVETRPERAFEPRPRPDLLITTADMRERYDDPHVRLLDARSIERYRGQEEPFDPVAGRIPGAISAPYPENLGPHGRFLSSEELRLRFEKLLGDASPEQAIHYCGSGVTATHNALAMAHAGLGVPPLYVGSWSEWITQPDYPIERG